MGERLQMTDGFGQVRNIGVVTGETLRTFRKFEKHLYRKLNAWCIDKDVFDEHDHIKYFVIEADDGQNYLATRDSFVQHAKPIQYPGHGVQLALPLDYWNAFVQH